MYVHRRYESVFGDPVQQAKSSLPEGFDYAIVKFVEKSGQVSFIESPDFDTADEPTVGEVVTVKPDGTVRRRKPSRDPQIYHHKWLFVRDDYPGFDVEASKRRSRSWLQLEDVDRSRIGYTSYWETHVVPRLQAGCEQADNEQDET